MISSSQPYNKLDGNSLVINFAQTEMMGYVDSCFNNGTSGYKATSKLFGNKT